MIIIVNPIHTCSQRKAIKSDNDSYEINEITIRSNNCYYEPRAVTIRGDSCSPYCEADAITQESNIALSIYCTVIPLSVLTSAGTCTISRHVPANARVRVSVRIPELVYLYE
jgi:hypothetical protein